MASYLHMHENAAMLDQGRPFVFIVRLNDPWMQYISFHRLLAAVIPAHVFDPEGRSGCRLLCGANFL